MHQASLAHPGLVTQVVPSPLTLKFDATIQDVVSSGALGELLYVEVPPAPSLHHIHLLCRQGVRLIRRDPYDTCESRQIRTRNRDDPAAGPC